MYCLIFREILLFIYLFGWTTPYIVISYKDYVTQMLLKSFNHAMNEAINDNTILPFSISLMKP